MVDSSALGALLAIGGLFLLLFGLLFLVFYFLLAFGLYRLAEKEKLENSWFAFIPILQLYLWGKLINRMSIFGFEVPNPELVMPLAALLSAVASGIKVLGPILSLVNAVVVIAAMYWLFRKYKGNDVALITVVSVIIPFVFPIMVFMMKDAEPVE